MTEPWKQRHSNYQIALKKLQNAVQLSQEREFSELEQQGLIHSFEFTHELAWKILKDFLASQGVSELFGSKDVTREAFQQGLITNGDIWMEMIKSRNLSSHTYDESIAKQIFDSIQRDYFPDFMELDKRLNSLL